MPQAGVPAHARSRYAAPWWEELDGDAFRFPTGHEVKPAPRAVARPGSLAAERKRAGNVAQLNDGVPARAARESALLTPEPEVSVPAVDLQPLSTATAAPRAADSVHPSGSRATDGGRRTVTIRGRGAERNLPVARPTLRRYERPGFRPDRAALWAVMLGLLLILVAAASAHAAILP
jgi:hypothetical protein